MLALVDAPLIHGDQSLIEFVNQVITQAIANNATDIHFEPYYDHYRIRFRIDGLLHKRYHLPKHLAAMLTSRLKIMANLDIAEKRLPQDGRYQTKDIDIRVNSCPTLHGEKIVLRLLNQSEQLFPINALGFNDQQQQDFLLAINKPQGLILVTGPTGSGKTTTLYSALQYLNDNTKNICTVEDPIEISLPNINQVNINNKTELNFPRVLRALLRQDPDIIMIGEIRDAQTAQIAIKAAQTGHLVLSTLHTTHTKAALTRLVNIGISYYDIISTLTLVSSQRLVRTLCPKCQQNNNSINAHSNKVINKQHDCHYCFDGYKGRIALHELLAINQLSFNSFIDHDIIATLLKYKITDLQQVGLAAVDKGVTSLAEIQRVIHY